MRIVSLVILALAACSSLSHAATNQEATYVIGSLDGIEAGTTGIVHFDADRITFHSGKLTIDAPFSKITGTELGAKLTHTADVQHHKLWEIHKRPVDRTVYQNLNINFKDASGKAQTMTLEMTEIAAAETFDTLELRTGQRARRQQQEGWWGDDIWRTNRNHESWDQTAALATSAKQ
jgi:hypothetical protein